MEEKWKVIESNSRYYSISNLGRVKRNKDDFIMKIFITSAKKIGGRYYRTKLNAGGEKRTLSIHREVAKYFCDGYSEINNEVNHIDGNTLNNVYTNLEWTTRKENMRHSVKTGLSDRKLSEEQVHEICQFIQEGVLTNKDISREFKVGHTAISNIRLGRSWSHISEQFGIEFTPYKERTNSSSKLNEEKVHEICKLLVKKELSAVNIGKQFDVAKTTINDISRGKTWSKIGELYGFTYN